MVSQTYSWYVKEKSGRIGLGKHDCNSAVLDRVTVKIEILYALTFLWL